MTKLLSEQSLNHLPKRAPKAFDEIAPAKVEYIDDVSSTGVPEEEIPLAF